MLLTWWKKLEKNPKSIFADYKAAAVADAYKRFILPLSRAGIRNGVDGKTDEQLSRYSGVNPTESIIAATLAGHCYHGVLDPGYRTGCKMALSIIKVM